MKALCFVALATAAFAQVAINPQYATAANGTCIVQPGFHIVGFTGATQPFTSPNAFPVANGAVCQIPPGEAVAVSCASGFVPVGAPDGVVANAPGSILPFTVTPSVLPTSTVEVTNVPANFATGFDITSNTTFMCMSVGCNFTCTTDNVNGTSGVGCNASGQLMPGQTAQHVCNTGFVATSNFTCPTNGSTATQQIVCSNDPTACNEANFVECSAIIGGGFSMPGSCNCFSGDNSTGGLGATCPPSVNANSPMCTDCTLPCDLAQGNTNPGLATRSAAGRQVGVPDRARAVFCPTSVDTIDEYVDCFQQAACAGVINPHTDICTFGGSASGTCAQGACPDCPSSSKKGLLGLLGLLGLIPLLLCVLLCLLLLCCIRRKKTERDVHFATFDAGAPTVTSPTLAQPSLMAMGPEVVGMGGPTFAGPTVF